MRKLSNGAVGVIAAAVCIFITVLTMDTDAFSMAFNLAVLAVMLVILAFSGLFGFSRTQQTIRGLDGAARKLTGIYQEKGDLEEVTALGSQIFQVEYLDRKYQEYLAYLRKADSPCDIGDYIGEYEINNYIHRRLIEMVPDILTSLGILGTFLGLVWGLRGFDPVSYEAMTSSVSSLINGIKVAFVTSIYGLTLSMAFSYWQKGLFSRLAESLDNFLDKYYLCAVPPTDTTAMNHVLTNQQEQIRLSREQSKELGQQITAGFEHYVEPSMEHLNQTVDQFIQTITLNQKDLLEQVSANVMDTMKSELTREFSRMRTLLEETNRVQENYVGFLSHTQEDQAQFQAELMEVRRQFQDDFLAGEAAVSRAMKTAGESQRECLDAMRTQQENLREFVDYMAQVMERMAVLNDRSVRTLEEVERQLQDLSQDHAFGQMEQLNRRLDQLIGMMEEQGRGKKRSFRSLFH